MGNELTTEWLGVLEEGDIFKVWFGAFIGFILGALIVGTVRYNEGFKEGQIEALTGNVQYELQVQPDSSRVWVKTKRKD